MRISTQVPAKLIALAFLVALITSSQPASALKIYMQPSNQLSNYSPDGYVEGTAMHIVAGKLQTKLANRGISSRNGDWNNYGTSDADAKAWNADCVLAIHTNACCASGTGWHSGHGTEMYPYQYSTNQASCWDLASRIGSKMVEKFTPFGAGYLRFVQWDTYSQFPSNPQADNILIEGLYHDNYTDCQALKSDAGQDAYAQAVFEAICDHYGWSYTASRELIIEPRGQNNQYYHEDGDANWGDSTGWCNSFDSGLTSGGSRYFPANSVSPTGHWVELNPVLRVPGGTYQVDVAHYDNNMISTDIGVSITTTNSTLSAANSSIFKQGQGCAWCKAGTIQLTAGATQPTVRFTYSGGNVNDASHRWNIEGFRFSLIQTSSYLTLNVVKGGTVTGGGSKMSGDSVTATAAPGSGYRFVSWTSGGYNGTVVSTDISYTFVMPGQDCTLYANFAHTGSLVTATPCPAGGGTTTGTDAYTPGTLATLTAAANPGYTFANWTSGSCGGTVVSTSPSYTLTAPSADVTYYANFTTNSYPLTLTCVPALGGTLTGGGMRVYNSSVTVTETPNPGFTFMGWRDSAGNVKSTSPSYTFTMPAGYMLTAWYAKASFYEGFENRNAGDIDMNESGGPNTGANGDKTGNPWFGADPRDAVVGSEVAVHCGTKALSATTGTMPYNCEDAVNLSYRCNNGNPYTGSVYMDWYFYDPKGTSGGDQFRDYAGLTKYRTSPVWSATQDYDFAAGYDRTLRDYLTQFLAIGASADTSSGYNSGVYQYRVMGASGGYGTSGWFNSTVARSIGWHHAMVTLGPAKTGGTNDASFYVDGTLLGTKDTVTTGGINSLSVYLRPQNYTSGAMDDISFGVLGTQAVQQWAVLGPYPFNTQDINPGHLAADYLSGSGASESSLYASLGKTYNGKGWTICDGGIADLGKVFNSPTYCVAYLFTYVVNNGPPVSGVDITFGSDDGVKLIWNGAGVYSHDVYRGFTMDQEHYSPVAFGTGVSRLMLKVTQGTSSFQAAMKVTQADGSQIPNLLFIPTDDTAPTGSIEINGGDPFTTAQDVVLYLSAGDDLSGVNKMSFSNDNVTWSTPEAFDTTKPWTLSSGAGPKTVWVKYTDKAGNYTICSAQTTYVIATAVAKISDLWALSNATSYMLSGKPVTGVSGNTFWIEETDRYAALKVTCRGAATAPLQDHLVDIIGQLDSSGTQRILFADWTEDKGPATAPILPFGITLRALGGVAPNASTPSIFGGKGVYNLGTLVKVAGAVSTPNTSDPNRKYFFLDDGSGVTDGSGHSGIKVITGTADPLTMGYARVIGIIDTETVNGQTVPVLIVRDAMEMQPE